MHRLGWPIGVLGVHHASSSARAVAGKDRGCQTVTRSPTRLACPRGESNQTCDALYDCDSGCDCV